MDFIYRINKKSDFNIVERKGVGHPDTLADLIAENFSNNYSKASLKKYGVLLNHWADKIVLRGGKADIEFGRAEVIEPITVYLFGRVVKEIGGR